MTSTSLAETAPDTAMAAADGAPAIGTALALIAGGEATAAAAPDALPEPAADPGDDGGAAMCDPLAADIASVVASLYGRAAMDEDLGETDDAAEPADDAITFQLLGELDRLWHRAAA